jgi:ubiquinol-cytochrome c reductase iron-sulfur subunit
MTPPRAVTLSFVVAMLGSLALVVVWALGGQPQVEGMLLAVAIGGIGVGVVIWAVRLIEAPIEVEDWHVRASTPEVRQEMAEAAVAGDVTRRGFLAWLLAGAGALLALVLALPAFSLGPGTGRSLFRTAWTNGLRVVDADGNRIRPADIGFDAVTTVYPEGHIGSPDSVALLVRVPTGELRLASGREAWAPEGCVAYSKICTHVGCPVGLYRAEERQLLCPCHQSTFDVREGAKPVFGPAVRPLPQLPMTLDEDGYLVATGDFPEPIGPSFWNMTHTS